MSFAKKNRNKRIVRIAVTGALIASMGLALSACGNEDGEAHSSVMAEESVGNGMKKASLEGFSFQVPETWQLGDSSTDYLRMYYVGDSDGEGTLMVRVYLDDTDFSACTDEEISDYIEMQTQEFTDFEMGVQEIVTTGIFSGIHFTGTFELEEENDETAVHSARADYYIVNANEEYAFVIGMIDYPDEGIDYADEYAEIIASFTED